MREVAAGRRRRLGLLRTLAAWVVALAVLTAVSLPAYAGWSLTHPARRAVDDSPARLAIPFDTVEFAADEDGVTLRGWFIPAGTSDRTVILAHGYGGNRLEKTVKSLDLAQKLNAAGFNVLLFDFRGAGLSGGNMTSFGYYEARDVLGAVSYLRRNRADRARHIGIMGFSMGAVAALEAAGRDPALEAVIMDSPYADLPRYLSRNLSRWTGLSGGFNWLVVRSLTVIGRIPVSDVSPVRQISRMTQPILVLYGQDDTTIPPTDSEELVQAAHRANVTAWAASRATPSWPSGVFPAGSPASYHVASREVEKDEYDRRVVEFFAAHLGAEASGGGTKTQ